MVTLNEIKEYLWINGTEDDAQLQKILDWVNSLVESAIWDITQGEKEMQVKNNIIKNEMIPLNITNPTSIVEINWNDFTWKVNWVDYFIMEDGNCKIKNLSSYIQNDFWVFKVKFIAGYSSTPPELIWLVADYVWFLFSKDMWKTLTQEQIWPRSVTFSDWMWIWKNFWTSSEFASFRKWLKKFIPLCYRIY